MEHLFTILLPVAVLLLSHFVSGSSSMESHVNINGTTNTTLAPKTEESEVLRKWMEIENMLKKTSAMLVKTVLPEAVRALQNIELSSNCSRSLMKFISGIKQMKLWAFRMLDSTGKIPEGMYSGSFSTLGDYDNCLDTVVPGSFQGQYCSLTFQLPLPERERFFPAFLPIKELVNFSRSDSVMRDVALKSRYLYRNQIRTALCVPSTCSSTEMEKITLRVIEQSGLSFNLTKINCEIKVDQVVFSTGEIVVIVLMLSLLLTCVVAAVVDIMLKVRSQDEAYQDNLSVPMKCLMSFSLYTNFLRLLKKDNSPDSIKIFYGMKVVTILWVILNHTYAYLNYQAIKSPLMHTGRHKELAMQFIINGYINVETFFFISAVLLAYGTMISKEQNINIFLFVIRRIWRLAPPFMLVIACVVFLIPHMGSGPVWKETVVESLSDKCRKSWWTNLLFINNFVSNKNMCMNWMWYIPADTHLYFISLLVIIPLKRNPKLAFIINILIFVLFTTITAVVHVAYRLLPTGIFILVIDQDIDEYLDNHYFRTWGHCATYTIGLTVGYLIVAKQKVHIPMKYKIVGWITCFTLALTVVYGVYNWNLGNFPGMFVSTLYACTNKLVFSLALGWVTFVCVTGNAGVVSSILSWGAFVPFSRLTYMTYLIHPIIQHMYVGSSRTVFLPDHRTMSMTYLSYVLSSFACACVLSLLFESPFLALEKVMISGRRRPRAQTPKNHEVEFGDHKRNGILHLNKDNGVYTINVKQIENDR